MAVRVVSVTSGKGGVGKSHLAANLAALRARDGQRVLVFDADAGMANVDVLLGAKPTLHLGHLLDGAAADEILSQVRPNLWLLPGCPGERRLVQLDDGARLRLTEVWRELVGRFDFIVVDVGSGVGDDVLFFAATGQTTLLVVTDEPTSVADAGTMLRALRSKTAVRDVDVVINGVRTAKAAQAVFARLQQGTEALGLRLRFTGNVPDDQNVRRAAMTGRPLVELAPTSPASRAFERVDQALRQAPARASTGGAWLAEPLLAP